MFGVVLVVAAAAACSDLCAVQSKCTADPALTSAQLQVCRDSMKDGVKCAQESRTAASCLQQKKVCASDGTTDAAASAANCSAELIALSVCSN